MIIFNYILCLGVSFMFSFMFFIFLPLVLDLYIMFNVFYSINTFTTTVLISPRWIGIV